jgi:dTDP-4-dehydrorhamnose reductase
VSITFLVTGASGLLGSKLVETFSSGDTAIGWSLTTSGRGLRHVDVRRADEVARALDDTPVDVCVHAAAMPDIAKCESDPDAAWELNAKGTEIVAHACSVRGVPLVYVSTDYVFDGKAEAYDETSPPSPLQVYGQTKLAGEQYALTAAPRNLTVRLPLLYGYNSRKPGMTFTKLVVETLRRGEYLTADDSELRQPTLTDDVATITRELVAAGAQGLVHIAAQHGETRYSWARRIAGAVGLPPELVSRADKKRGGAMRPTRSWLLVKRLQTLQLTPPMGLDEALLPNLQRGGYR